MKCLMEVDRSYGLTWPEKVAFMTVNFLAKAQIACAVTHSFEPGVYIREMKIPQGVLFVGRPHRYGHHVELVSGKVLLIEEHRKVTVEAPFGMVSGPCYQTIFYAMTDVVGRTRHPNPTESRDTQAMEDDIFRPASEVVMIGESVQARITLADQEKLAQNFLQGEAA